MIDVNFNPPPGPGKAWWILLGLLATIVAVVWAVVLWLGLERATIDRELATMRAAIESQQRLTLQSAQGAAAAPPYAAGAQEAWKRGRFEAAAALTAIEAVLVDGVSVQAVEVAAEQSVVKVELIVSDHERLNQYLDHLNAGLPMVQWRIAQVSMVSSQQAAALRATLVYRH